MRAHARLAHVAERHIGGPRKFGFYSIGLDAPRTPLARAEKVISVETSASSISAAAAIKPKNGTEPRHRGLIAN